MGGGQGDLAANYQNYLLQYQQQNANASQQPLGSSSGVPPPAVGVPPPGGATTTSQTSAASNPAFNFGMQLFLFLKVFITIMFHV